MKDKDPSKIFLVGMMGTGKTSIGSCVARKLKLKFLDSDHEIERLAGADIHWIFDVEGEEGFRTREQQIIDDITQHEGIVLATGGGAIVRKENQRVLKERGIVVYLKANLEELTLRTRYGRTRPMLRVGNRKEILDKLYKEREHLYESIADFTYRTDEKSMITICRQICRDINDLKKS